MLRLDFNLVWTVVNIIVLYLLLKHFLIQPVMAVMDKRQAMIDDSIAKARSAESDADALKSRYEEKIRHSAEEGEKLIEEARMEAKNQNEKLMKEAEEEANRIMENAKRTAAVEQEKAMREAEARIAGLVIAAASKVVGSEVNEMRNQALFDKFIAEAGESHDADGR